MNYQFLTKRFFDNFQNFITLLEIKTDLTLNNFHKFVRDINRDVVIGVMYRVCALQMGANVAVQLAAEKNFYLRLTVEKIHVFAVFNNKYLRPYGCIDTKITATVNCTNPKTEKLSAIIEMQIIRVQILMLEPRTMNL